VSISWDDRVFEIPFTPDDVKLVLQDQIANDAITERIRAAAPAGDGEISIPATIEELDDLLDSLAAFAGHCDDATTVDRLDLLSARLEMLGRVLLLLEQARGAAPKPRPAPRDRRRDYVLELRIELLGVDPPIWRRIQISSESTLWDLHVAIQDAMGWQDYHLHEFQFLGTNARVGIPLEDETLEMLPGWEQRVDHYLSFAAPLALYQYDFGDSWLHEIRFEGVFSKDARRNYPRCLAGVRHCPPEDCGGADQYAEFLRAIADPEHEEHQSYLDWVGGRFNPEAFDARKVRFSDSRTRLKEMLEDPDEA
jgi:hypothetical protein